MRGKFFYFGVLFWVIGSLLPIATNAQIEQNGWGIRFASDINYYYRAKGNELMNGSYSNSLLGIFYKQYYNNGTIEAGFNFGYKERPGGFAFPLVMQNFQAGDSTAVTFYEFEFKCGPRVGWVVYPKFGLRAGYRTRYEGVLEDDSTGIKLNPYYFTLPMGCGLDLPTGFGTVGISFYYSLGISNNLIYPKDTPKAGKMHTFNFELHVMLANSSSRRNK